MIDSDKAKISKVMDTIFHIVRENGEMECKEIYLNKSIQMTHEEFIMTIESMVEIQLLKVRDEKSDKFYSLTEISPEDALISKIMIDLAKAIDQTLKKYLGADIGFSLVVFNTENDSRANYVSNCKREDVHKALSELVDFWEKGSPDIPGDQFKIRD